MAVDLNRNTELEYLSFANASSSIQKNRRIMESLARDDDFLLPDNVDTSQHCELVSDSRTFANFLPAAGAISIACYAYLFWMYFVLKSPILKRHPTTLAIFKCFFELLFVQQYLWVPRLSNQFEAYDDDASIAPFHCNASPLAAAMSFLSQFALLGSELCFLIISIDLRNAYTNPFTSFKQNRVKYFFLVVFFAAVSAVLMLACGPQVYGMSRLGLFWMQPRRDSEISINYPQALLFYAPSVCIFCYCIWANFQFYKGVSKGLAQTIGNRLSIMERSKRYTAAYIAYASLVFIIEFVSFLQGNSLSNEFTQVPAFFYALRGVWAVIVILYSNEQEASWHTLHPFRLSLPQELLRDVAAERLLLQPHLNVALRAEILYFATQGIICAASDIDDSAGSVLLEDAVDAEAHNETRLFGYEVTDTLQSQPSTSDRDDSNEVKQAQEKKQQNQDKDVESDSRHSLFNLFQIDNAGVAIHSHLKTTNYNSNNAINNNQNNGNITAANSNITPEGLQRLRRLEQAQSKRVSARFLFELTDELKALGADESLLQSHEHDNVTNHNTHANSNDSSSNTNVTNEGNHVNFNPLQQHQQKAPKLRFILPSTDANNNTERNSVDGSGENNSNSYRSNSRSYSREERIKDDQNGIEMADSASYNNIFANDQQTFTGVNINSIRENKTNNKNNSDNSSINNSNKSSSQGSTSSGWRRLNSNDSVRSASAESVASNYYKDNNPNYNDNLTRNDSNTLETRQLQLSFSFNNFSFSSNSTSNNNNSNSHLSTSSGWNGLLQSAVSRATAALSPAYQDFRFKDFAPRLFARIRKMHNIHARDYAAAFETTCRERFSEGRSGAFLFFSQDERFIVKTMSSEECVSLRRILPMYVKHLLQHPQSLLVRFLGVHSLVMYGVELSFCVMLNVFPVDPLSERYDLKGSWVNRHGQNNDKNNDNKNKYFNNRRKRLRRRKQRLVQLQLQQASASASTPVNVDHSDSDSEDESAPLYQDNDLQLPISLQPSVAKALADTIRRDIIFLRDLNFMDYSLLIGVRRERFQVVSQSSGSNTGVAPAVPLVTATTKIPHSTSLNKSNNSSSANNSSVHHLSGGLNAAEVEGPSIYYVGVIDVLQQWDFRKRLEQFFKTKFLFLDIEGLSAIEPRSYCSRFWSRAVLDTFEHLELLNDDPDNP